MRDLRESLELTAVTLGGPALAAWLARRYEDRWKLAGGYLRGAAVLSVKALAGRDTLLAAPATTPPGADPDVDDLFSETWEQQMMRRLEACEVHLTDLEERFGPIDQYIGGIARNAMGDSGG